MLDDISLYPAFSSLLILKFLGDRILPDTYKETPLACQNSPCLHLCSSILWALNWCTHLSLHDTAVWLKPTDRTCIQRRPWFPRHSQPTSTTAYIQWQFHQDCQMSWPKGLDSSLPLILKPGICKSCQYWLQKIPRVWSWTSLLSASPLGLKRWFSLLPPMTSYNVFSMQKQSEQSVLHTSRLSMAEGRDQEELQSYTWKPGCNENFLHLNYQSSSTEKCNCQNLEL